MRRLIAATLLSLTSFSPAFGQADPQLRGEYTDWRVFTRDTDQGLVCYALSRPTDSSPRNHAHGSVYFIVASWQSGIVEEQPNLLVGYDLRPASPPEIRIGSSRYDMFVDGQEGFLDDLDDEPRVIRSMERGSAMRVTATTADGVSAAYEFSLRGVTAAIQRVGALC